MRVGLILVHSLSSFGQSRIRGNVVEGVRKERKEEG